MVPGPPHTIESGGGSASVPLSAKSHPSAATAAGAPVNSSEACDGNVSARPTALQLLAAGVPRGRVRCARHARAVACAAREYRGHTFTLAPGVG
jgi:hypothetical protein